MGFFSSIGNFVSDAVSVISSVASSVGSALASAAKTLLNIAGNYFSPVIDIITSIAKILGIFEQEDNPEDLGRLAVASNKKPEDFDSIAEYIQHLKNDIKVDWEKIGAENKKEKLAYQAIGATITMKAINEEKGFSIPVETWVTFAKLGLENKEAEVNALLDNFKGDGINDFVDYAQGRLTPDKEIEVGDRLAEVYKDLDPELSEEAIEQKVKELEMTQSSQTDT